jgi:hypothetical protein
MDLTASILAATGTAILPSFRCGRGPGERHDLTAAHPELVRKLEAAIDGWERDVDTKIVST